MTNRRDFLRAVGYAGAGTLLIGGAFGARAQSTRKEVFVGGRRATVVDIHAHCAFHDELRARLPNAAPDGRRAVLGPDRLEEMDARGIDIQQRPSIHRKIIDPSGRNIRDRFRHLHPIDGQEVLPGSRCG